MSKKQNKSRVVRLDEVQQALAWVKRALEIHEARTIDLNERLARLEQAAGATPGEHRTESGLVLPPGMQP